ncbi:MAG: NTP transferase domain-containing protein, partial [Planctomycetota bacterium]
MPDCSAVTAIILAAGQGSRMGSNLAKVLHPLAGRPMIQHVLGTCRAIGIGQRLVVVGHQRAAVAAALDDPAAETVIQEDQLGT